MKYRYCLLEKFNNYFNRKIIRFDDYGDYTSSVENYYEPLDSKGNFALFDFNPNDNVTTEITVNDCPFDPDYFLLIDEDEEIISRWFVIEQVRNRQGQWKYFIKRDVISDNLSKLENAPIFVQKGMLSEDDPMIVNDEGCNFNKIKKSETLLRDNTNVAWAVAYIAKNKGGSDISVQADATSLNVPHVTLPEIADDLGISESQLAAFINTDGFFHNYGLFTQSLEIQFGYHYSYATASADNRLRCSYTPDMNLIGVDAQQESGATPIQLFNTSNPYYMQQLFGAAIVAQKANILAQIQTILYNRPYYLTSADASKLSKYVGKYVLYNGKYYKLNLRNIGTIPTSVIEFSATAFSSLRDVALNVVTTGTPTVTLATDAKYYSFSSFDARIAIMLEEVSVADLVPQLNTTVSTARQTVGDQEYDIIAIPYGSISFDVSGNEYTSNISDARRIMSALAMELDASCYDIQLLPYCPVELVINNGVVDLSGMTEHFDYELVTKNISDIIDNFAFTYSDFNWSVSPYNSHGTATKTVPNVPAGSDIHVTETVITGLTDAQKELVTNLAVTESGDSVSIAFDYSGDYLDLINIGFQVYCYYDDTTTPATFMLYGNSANLRFFIDEEITSAESKKVQANCDMYRLVSPNYQGAFEFNLAKNGGSVDGFNVFCTFKPYTPLIKIAPNFNFLYGQEFADNRGLICGGDFSLPRVNSAWESYQLQNKNYQNIFNRDIQHLSFEQGIEMRNQYVSGGVGIFSDTIKGAGAGAMVGGGWGALAGAAVGSITSGVGYAVDTDTLKRQQKEALDYSIDKFSYQLGNIKALPYTLTKVGAFDAISKIFPVLEYYTCTDTEKEAFNKKIQYESMTVMRIGTLLEFMKEEPHYFKGSLIRCDEVADDSHILDAIYEELLKGVYI